MEHEGLSLYLFERKAPLAFFLNSLSSVKSPPHFLWKGNNIFFKSCFYRQSFEYQNSMIDVGNLLTFIMILSFTVN